VLSKTLDQGLAIQRSAYDSAIATLTEAQVRKCRFCHNDREKMAKAEGSALH